MADTSNTLPAIEILLFSQHKYAEAEKELRNFLSTNPDNDYGHSLLALALLNLNRNTESLKEAQNSVHLNPNNPYCYYILSIVQLNSCDDLSAAESSIKNALRLNPDTSASYYSIYATIKIKQQKSGDALELVNKGLEINPQHEDCLQNKALILLNMDKLKESGEVIETALQNNPEDDEIFRIKGWLAIEKKDYGPALDSFRESLRINPTNDLAKEGLVRALKMKSRIFRFFAFWDKQRGGKAAIAALLIFFASIIISEYFGKKKFISEIVISVLLLLFSSIFYLKSAITPLYNLALRFNKYGKFALTRGQIWDANLITAFLGLSAIQLMLSIITNGFYTPLGAIGTLLLVLPVSGVFEKVNEKHFFKLFAMLIILLLLLTSCIVFSFSEKAPNIQAIVLSFSVFGICCIIFKFISDKLK